MKFWKKLWGASQPAQTGGVEVEPGHLHASQETEAHFLAFVELLTGCVAEDEAQRILRVARAAWRARAAEDTAAGSFAQVDACQVLEEVMAGEDGQRPGQWLVIHLDWKATEEVGWQVADILAQRKLQPTWAGIDEEFDTVPAAFMDLAQWLQQRGLALLDIETDADAFCAFIVDDAQVARARQLAQAARLTLYDAEEFAARN
jgi:hypothetical protein